MKKKIDWFITLVPLIFILFLAVLFFVFPNESNTTVSQIRFFFGDTFGSYYLIIGLGIFLLSIYIASSKYGKIRLGGQDEKPKYSFFNWGAMMFTAGLAADILFYSFSEWILYASNAHIEKLGMEEWANVYPLFHWSFIPWSFYLVLAVAFGFMLHVRKVNRQKFSEACRPLFGKHIDGFLGKLIDLFAVFALLAGTATTFTLATPLMTSIITKLFHVTINETILTIIIIVITCIIYTYSLLHGFKGVSFLANLCIYLFGALLVIFLLFGGQFRSIIELSLQSFGKMVQNFFELSTYTDPQRTTNFPQDWTIFYWAYWMVWSVATPFFIGNISRGRTIKETILGGYIFGVGSTLISFMILGNFSFAQQLQGMQNYIVMYQQGASLYEIILKVIDTMPLAPFILVLVLLTMIAFYATSFDSIAYTASCYSYHELKEGEHPHRAIQFMWCILLVVLPIALIFSQSSMSNLQSVSIIAAFPLAMIMIVICISFIKDVRTYLNNLQDGK